MSAITPADRAKLMLLGMHTWNALPNNPEAARWYVTIGLFSGQFVKYKETNEFITAGTEEELIRKVLENL